MWVFCLTNSVIIMRYQRYLLLASLWFSCAGLTGFKQPPAHLLSVHAGAVASSATSQGKNNTHADKPKTIGENGAHPLLDLTLPDAALQFTSPAPTTLQAPAQNSDSGLFVKPTPKQPSALQLKGGWVMSQEPEVEKRKSVDGAGISINLRP